MTDSIYNDEAIIRSVTYHGKAGHKISLELSPEGWERLKGMETTRCMMVLVPIQNDGQPDPDAKPTEKPYPDESDLKKWGKVTALAEKPRKAWADLTPTQQAGIRCSDVDFQAWLGCFDAEEAAVKVRSHCGVKSRSDIGLHPASKRWREMDNNFLERNIG